MSDEKCFIEIREDNLLEMIDFVEDSKTPWVEYKKEDDKMKDDVIDALISRMKIIATYLKSINKGDEIEVNYNGFSLKLDCRNSKIT